MAKVQISIDDDLLVKVDDYCKKNCITRSGFISMMCSQWLQKEELTKTLNILQGAMLKVTEGKDLPPEQQQEIDDYMRLVSMFNQAK
jgi:metal-responsive CopG/Arc/MetJ family transcriptional regulator